VTADQLIEGGRAPALVPMRAVTLAVASGRSTGFRAVSTERRADELLRELATELADQGVSMTGCASMSVVAVDDVGVGIGVGIEVGVVVSVPVTPTETIRVVDRPSHDAVTLLVPGDQTDRDWARLRAFLADLDVVALRRSYVSFQHPRRPDETMRFTQLVQPVTLRDR
jgi:sulfite reductase beta subunit-like hemoprotein